ncbi:hypothetical protein [Scopulibacillus cellulosilyticus]|uniref:WXG100 family type VII secretion target n=1 Tax=Scopulibacillus cellulosilyticus TaxID=2665665 RepID=A0ABW2Q101_9BACL
MGRIMVDPEALQFFNHQLLSFADNHSSTQQYYRNALQSLTIEPKISSQINSMIYQLNSQGSQIENNTNNLSQYLNRKINLFLDVDNMPVNFRASGTSELGRSYVYGSLASQPRVKQQNVKMCYPVDSSASLTGTSSKLNSEINKFEDNAIPTAGSIIGNSRSAYTLSKAYRRYRKGFGVTKGFYTTAQGKTRVRVRVSNPNVEGFNKKTYSHIKATNYKKLYKWVDPKTAVKENLKITRNGWKFKSAGAFTYLGVGLNVAQDITFGVRHNLKGNQIAGNVIGDLGIGIANAAISTAAGVEAGAMIGTVFGGPIGTFAGAAAGFFISKGLSFAENKLKIYDIDYDGKKDSISGIVKKGTSKIIGKIGSWFK